MKITFLDLPKNQPLNFEYHFYPTPFGSLLVISWEKSLVYAAFADSQAGALKEAKARFPEARFTKKETAVQKSALRSLKNPRGHMGALSLASRGSDLQKKVWKALAATSRGRTLTYSDLAKKVKRPQAVRAVASAVARNPFAIFIPCHRVLPKSGGTGNYHWGAERKVQLLSWESKR